MLLMAFNIGYEYEKHEQTGDKQVYGKKSERLHWNPYIIVEDIQQIGDEDVP